MHQTYSGHHMACQCLESGRSCVCTVRLVRDRLWQLLPLIFLHILHDDSLRILGNKRPVANAKWEGHPRVHETSPIANDGAVACQQRDTDGLTVKSDGHGLEEGICKQYECIICRNDSRGDA